MGHELKPHQVEGVRHLRARCAAKLSTLLADYPGLGKTLQVVTLLQHVESALIVVPLSAISIWTTELAPLRISHPALFHSVVVQARKLGSLDVTDAVRFVVTTYGALRSAAFAWCVDPASGKCPGVLARRWAGLVLDEADLLRKSKGGVGDAGGAGGVGGAGGECAMEPHIARVVARVRRDWTICATATPCPTSVADMVAMCRILDHTGKQVWSSAAWWDRVVRLGRLLPGPDRLILQGLILRRTRDLLELPRVTHTIVELSMTPEQARRVRELVWSQAARVMSSGTLPGASPGATSGAAVGKKESQASLALLRDALYECMSPHIRAASFSGDVLANAPKIRYVHDYIARTPRDESVCVFSSSLRMLQLLRKALQKTTSVRVFAGNLSSAKRIAMEADFQGGAFRVLLASIKAGGTCLTLTRANHVLLVDENWSPDVAEQTESRVVRQGQSRPVHVLRLRMRGPCSVDPFVVAHLASKLRHMVAIFPDLAHMHQHYDATPDIPHVPHFANWAQAVMCSDEALSTEERPAGHRQTHLSDDGEAKVTSECKSAPASIAPEAPRRLALAMDGDSGASVSTCAATCAAKAAKPKRPDNAPCMTPCMTPRMTPCMTPHKALQPGAVAAPSRATSAAFAWPAVSRPSMAQASAAAPAPLPSALASARPSLFAFAVAPLAPRWSPPLLRSVAASPAPTPPTLRSAVASAPTPPTLRSAVASAPTPLTLRSAVASAPHTAVVSSFFASPPPMSRPFASSSWTSWSSLSYLSSSSPSSSARPPLASTPIRPPRTGPLSMDGPLPSKRTSAHSATMARASRQTFRPGGRAVSALGLGPP